MMLPAVSQSKEEERARQKQKSKRYAEQLDNQLKEQHQIHQQQEQLDFKRYGEAPPPPKGDVWKIMKTEQDASRKQKQNNYAQALDTQRDELATFRAPSSQPVARVLLTSESQLKIRAITQALTTVSIATLNSPSGVSSQPIGLQEIMAGARNRMDDAIKSTPSSSTREADFLISIENGLTEVGPIWLDIGVVIVRDILSSSESFSTTTGVQVPNKFVNAWRAQAGQRVQTCGEWIAKENNCNKDDPHSFLTNGTFQREDLLASAIRVAFSTLNGKSDKNFKTLQVT